MSAATFTLPLFPLLGFDEDGTCVCGPDCERPGKHPAIKWKAPVGRERYASIDEYLRRHPNVEGIGARMGGGILVLDFDPRSEGFESRQLLEDEFAPLPETAVSLTGLYDEQRGEHWWYLYDPGTYIRKRPLSKVLGDQYSGIDVQADGGFVVMPPTPHLSGVDYEWRTPLDAIADAPEWLTTLLNTLPASWARNGPESASTRGFRRRRGTRLPRYTERWVYGEQGVPSPQWEKIAGITAALWDDTEAMLSVEQIGELIYEALIRSPDYDPSRPWSKAKRIEDARRLLSKDPQ